MWTLDVLSVGFRSLAVAKLADDGIYSFFVVEHEGREVFGVVVDREMLRVSRVLRSRVARVGFGTNEAHFLPPLRRPKACEKCSWQWPMTFGWC